VEDAVVVYGANGSVYLITRNGCERSAEFQPDKNTALVKAGLSAMTGAGSEGTSALRQIADVLEPHGGVVWTIKAGDLEEVVDQHALEDMMGPDIAHFRRTRP